MVKIGRPIPSRVYSAAKDSIVTGAIGSTVIGTYDGTSWTYNN